MLVASGKIGVKVMMELCQRLLDGREMPDGWKTNVIVPIFKGKSDVMSCGSYREVKLLEHALMYKRGVSKPLFRRVVYINLETFYLVLTSDSFYNISKKHI